MYWLQVQPHKLSKNIKQKIKSEKLKEISRVPYVKSD